MTNIIYYYQTFIGLDKILSLKNKVVDVIIVGALHFGIEGKPYLHLNNINVTDSSYEKLWNQLSQAYNKNIKITFMLGGAGTAYTDLFNNYDTYL